MPHYFRHSIENCSNVTDSMTSCLLTEDIRQCEVSYSEGSTVFLYCCFVFCCCCLYLCICFIAVFLLFVFYPFSSPFFLQIKNQTSCIDFHMLFFVFALFVFVVIGRFYKPFEKSLENFVRS